MYDLRRIWETLVPKINKIPTEKLTNTINHEFRIRSSLHTYLFSSHYSEDDAKKILFI